MRGESIQVLLVEDEAAHAELVGRAFDAQRLLAREVELIVAVTLRQARTWLAHAEPALVITDLRLPDGNGVDLLPAAGETARYPVVIMTSRGDEQVAVEAMKAGALDYVVKTKETLTQMPRIARRALREWSHIIERQQAEAALRENEERFRQLFNNSPDAIFVEDLEGYVLDVNEEACRLHGVPRGRLLGQHIERLVPPDQRARVREHYARLVRGEVSFVEGYSWTSDERAIPVEIRASHVTYMGQPALLLHVRDITRRKEAEASLRHSEEQIRHYNEELEQLVRRRTARIRELERQRAEIEKLAATGRMAAGIAHEINNPLASIMSSFELVSSAIPVDHPRYDFVRRIEKDLDRVAMIIRRMYNLYKPVQEAAQTFAVEAMLAEVQLLLEAYGRQHAVEVQVEARGADEAVCLPPTSVHQVLFNIIQNAIDASPPGAVVKVVAEMVEGWLHVAVQDKGCGIEGGVRNQIFEPFFSTKQTGSMGLGLAIARSLATAMGGSIMFDGAPGEGAVFHITLPRRLELYAEIEQGS